MYKQKIENINGFTLFEVILVIAIIGIISSITFLSFSNFHSGQALPNTVDEVTALFDEARSSTLAGKGGIQYGVHLQSDRAILFAGTTYSSTSTSNKIILTDSLITIASTTLQGGGSDVLFNRLTGETGQYGTFIVKNTSTSVGQKTVTISKTGSVSSN